MMDNMTEQPEEQYAITKTNVDNVLFAVKANKNLPYLKGYGLLEEAVLELLRSLEEYEGRLITTIVSSKGVSANLNSLVTTLHDVKTFLDKLGAKTFVFHQTSKLRAKISHFVHLLRSKSTQLLTSITLELLSQGQQPSTIQLPIPPQPMVEKENHVPVSPRPPPPPEPSTKPTLSVITSSSSSKKNTTSLISSGNNSYYGIPPIPKNYAVAIDFYREAADLNDPEGMFMLAECYDNGYGLEKNKDMGQSWLAKAVAVGHPQAMHKNAMQVLKELDLHDAEYLRKVLSNLDHGQHLDNPSPVPWSSVSSSLFSPWNHHPLSTTTSITPISSRSRSNSADNSVLNDARAQKEVDAVFLQQAIQLLFHAAQRGLISAKTDLGFLFELSGDVVRAIEWFEQAMEEGCPRAMNKMGVLMYTGKGMNKNVDQAYSLFITAALSGDKDANNNAGQCLEQGIGDKHRGESAELALKWYERGAQLGSFAAMYSYGYLLLRKAIRSLQECDDFVHSHVSKIVEGEGMFSEGVCMLENSSEKVSESIAKGIQNMLSVHEDATGDMHSPTDSNHSGKKPPLAKRPVSLSQSALSSVSDNIHVKSFSSPIYSSHSPLIRQRTGLVDHDMNSVGSAFSVSFEREKAHGLARDGVRWLHVAAEGGYIEARYQLGLVYLDGLGGVPVDKPSALIQFETAATLGHTKAALAVAQICYDQKLHDLSSITTTITNGKISPLESNNKKDFRKCAEYYLRAADGDCLSAMNALGLLLEDGRGCSDLRPDPIAAAGWYMQACLSPRRDEDDNCAIQEAAVNLALLLSSNTTITNFPSVEMDNNQQYSIDETKKLLHEILAKNDDDFRWNVPLKERLHEVLLSMN